MALGGQQMHDHSNAAPERSSKTDEVVQSELPENGAEQQERTTLSANGDNSQDEDNIGSSSSPRSFSFLFVGSVANLCSATLGAGVLSLPYALLESGLVGGAVLLVMAAWASIVSINFLVQASDVYQRYTYESLVEKALGHRTRILVEVCMILFCGGCAVAYVMAVGDILQQVVPELPRNVSLCCVWATAMLPLSLLTRMESLQWASGIGVTSIMVLVLAVLVHYIQDSHHQSKKQQGVYDLLKPESGILSLVRACPMVIFAFSCQVNVCAIYHELPQVEHKQRLMNKVTCTAVMGCTVLYATISTLALLDFQQSVQPNILVNYCPRGIMHVAFGCMALAVVMAFPLNVFPARVALNGIMDKRSRNDRSSGEEVQELQEPLLLESNAESSQEENIEPTSDTLVVENGEATPGSLSADFNLFRHVTLTLGIAGTALALALVVPDISVVFGLLGGTTSSALGFVIPGLLGKSLQQQQRQQGRVMQSFQAWILIVGGTLVGVLTTGVTIWSTFAQGQSSSRPVPDACHTTPDLLPVQPVTSTL